MDNESLKKALYHINNELGEVMYWYEKDLRNDKSPFVEQASFIADVANALLKRLDALINEIEATERVK